MPNPDGVNGFDRFRSEAVYGAKKKMTDLVAGAPVSPSLNNTARRSQKKAARRERPVAVTPETMPPPVVAPAPELTAASVWAELAAHPEASDLVRRLAAEAHGS